MTVLNQATKLRYGAQTVDRVYAGSVQVWPPPPSGDWGPDEYIFALPPTGTSPQGAPFTFGFRFTPVKDGRITGVRFYSYYSAANRPVSIWSDAGVKLAHGVGGIETGAGWQIIPLETPLPVAAGVPLVTSYGWHNSWSQFGYTTEQAVSASPNLIAHKGSYYWGDMDTFPATDGGQHYYADVVYQEHLAPAPAFSPKDLTGLLFWLDAQQLTAADGAGLAAWPDVSGNDLYARTLSGTPTYHTGGINGHPAVRFGEGGVFASMRVDPLPRAVGDRTVFQVLVATPGNSFGPYHTTQVQEYDPYLQTYGAAGGTVHTYTTADVDSGVAWSGNCQFITLWASTAASRHWLEVDGHQVSQSWAPSASASYIFIGGFQPGGYALNGWIGENITYERCLTDSERGQVLDYLRAKWAP